MLDSILINSGETAISLSTKGLLICCLTSVVLGLCIGLVYMVSSDRYSKNFVITLAIIPILVQAVIMLVNGNLGTGVAIVGAFSLVRFRSIPGNAKEIGTVFFAMAVGLATGTGYIGYAVIISLIVSLMIIVLSKLNFGSKKEGDKQLRVVIPENLNYVGLFDDIFDNYLSFYKIDRVKTTNLGSMFEVTYLIKLKDDSNEKQMIDDIRVRNGNLTVVCGRVSNPIEEL